MIIRRTLAVLIALAVIGLIVAAVLNPIVFGILVIVAVAALGITAWALALIAIVDSWRKGAAR